MEKNCGKKYLLSLIWRDSLHIKRALRSIHDSKERLEERERVRTHLRCSSSSSMFFGLKLRCCRSKKTTLGGWIPYVPPPEDNFSCHVSQVRFLCSIGRDDVFFDDFPPPEKTDWKMIVCGCALLFVFLSSHTHLVLCVVNNKCLLSLDDDDNRSR